MSLFLIQSNQNIYTYTTAFKVISTSLKEEDFLNHGLTEEELENIPSSAWQTFDSDYNIMSLVPKEYETIHHTEEKTSIIDRSTSRGKIAKVPIDLSSCPDDAITGIEVK